MKMTDIINFEKDSQKNQKNNILDENFPTLSRPTKSLRPQKSMVRVKSCKPKKMVLIKGIKPLNK